MNKIYQISTLQALIMGYSKKAITVEEYLTHGDTGLGTYADLDGEMITLDGVCYRAHDDGSVTVVDAKEGIPFAVCSKLRGDYEYELNQINSYEQLTNTLNNRIDALFALNSMHLIRIDGEFDLIHARSESPFRSQHIELKEIMPYIQKEFFFEHIKGSLICLYFPDYMQGINASGWHFHFISEDRMKGGHVFELAMKHGAARHDRIAKIEMEIPAEPAFDTYELNSDKNKDIQAIEQKGD